jgi:hypothetical protein
MMLELDGGICALMLGPQTITPSVVGEYRLGESADGVGGM